MAGALGCSHLKRDAAAEAGSELVAGLDVVTYPASSIKTLAELGLTAARLAKRAFDIHSDADRANRLEPGAQVAGGSRFPFISCHGRKNVKVLGRGTIDFTRFDWHERVGMAFNFSNNIEIRGITLVNSGNWTVTLYRVTNLQSHDLF